MIKMKSFDLFLFVRCLKLVFYLFIKVFCSGTLRGFPVFTWKWPVFQGRALRRGLEDEVKATKFCKKGLKSIDLDFNPFLVLIKS